MAELLHRVRVLLELALRGCAVGDALTPRLC